jgi:hypothetical protein
MSTPESRREVADRPPRLWMNQQLSATLPRVEQQESYAERLERACATGWPAIRAARRRTAERVAEVRSELWRFESPWASVIVTGSVGCGERASSENRRSGPDSRRDVVQAPP